MRTPLVVAVSALAALSVHCKSDEPSPNGAADAGGPSFSDVPLMETLDAPGLSAPVEVVRDDYGVPHIKGETDADVVYAQAYMMASDRFIQMELGRRQAAGTLSEVLGNSVPTIVDTDVSYRMHHLKQNGERIWAALQASSDPVDKKCALLLGSFTRGVNAWLADLRAGKRALPSQVADTFKAAAIEPWSEADSLALGDLQAFNLAFDADGEVALSTHEAGEAKAFVGSSDAVKASRVGFVGDFYRFAPFDATFTVDGWPNAKLATNAAPNKGRGGSKRDSKGYLALLEKAGRSLRGVGLDRMRDPSRGSNNWVVSGKHTASGLPIVANDTHLSIGQPAIFYLSHLQSREGLDLMGVQFPGIPLVILGMNRRVAWGGTVNYIDVTDVYRETVKDCNGTKCVVWKGQDVPLTPRVETFKIGSPGLVSTTKQVTIWDVPHHGPILVRSLGGNAEPLGAEELSIRYTGHEPAPLFKAVYGLATAKTVDDAKAALDANFKYGGQNWVMGDDSGNVLWTQSVRVPRRPKGTRPWAVMPGDGSAEWSGDHDVKLVPASRNPDKGFLVTANADPLGVTADNDPMNEPEVDGFPLYLAADYDMGTRVGRITKRIAAAIADGKKLSRDDMANIQADAYSEVGEALAPAFLEGARALADELATPGKVPGLGPVLAAMGTPSKAALTAATEAVAAWSFGTPAGNDGESPESLRDSRATLLVAVFTTRLAKNVLADELSAVGASLGGSRPTRMLATLIKTPDVLKTKTTVWDDLNTPEVETRAVMLARSVAQALDFITGNAELGPSPDGWRWGKVHRLVSTFPLSAALSQPPVPRHGGDGTVDVAFHGANDDSYDFSSGPAIRFVAEMDPAAGPRARNVTPGGQIFYKESPHFGDLFARWVNNEAVDLAFTTSDIVARAKKEQATTGLGRVVFKP